MASARATSSRLRRPMGSERARLSREGLEAGSVAITRRAASARRAHRVDAGERADHHVVEHREVAERLHELEGAGEARARTRAWGASPLMSRPSKPHRPRVGRRRSRR